MVVRLSRILLMAAIALWLLLVAFGNITDYDSNRVIVQHVLAMDSILAIGGEWFGMWMSSQWNGLESAFRFVVVLLVALVCLGQHDDELDQP